MPIGEQSPIASHTGNGVATVFAFSFGVLAASDIKVLVDGVEVTTGFTVAGVGSRTGGTVTFAVAPTNGADILIVREVVRKRDTDYQYSGDLREEVVDDDFDRIWMALQEDGELVQRGVRAPVGETLSELPAAASRVDKVLTFGAGGAIALVDIAAFSGGGVVELVPADGSIALVKLTSAVQNLINGALQKSGGAMLADIILAGDTADDLGAVPKQQAQEIANAAAASAVSDRLRFQRIAPVATTSGGSVALSTAIPSWAKEIDIVFAGVSINTANSILVRVGSGGLATSGYASTSTTANNASATSAFSSTTGFAVELAGDPPNALRGTMRLIKLDDSANTWVQSHSMTKNSNNSLFGGGEITLAGALTHISLVCNVGGDVFDAGSAAIVVKG